MSSAREALGADSDGDAVIILATLAYELAHWVFIQVRLTALFGHVSLWLTFHFCSSTATGVRNRSATIRRRSTRRRRATALPLAFRLAGRPTAGVVLLPRGFATMPERTPSPRSSASITSS